MTRAFAATAAAVLTSCLLAPGKPAATGDAATIDGPPADAYAGGRFCPGSGDRFGASIAFDRGSGYDSVYRVGVGSQLGPLVARWDDPIGSPCADAAVVLADDGLGAARTLDAITVANLGGGSIEAFVLASAGTAAAVHQITDTGGLTDVRTYGELGLAPTPVTTISGSSDQPAFITYVALPAPTVWFGGGSALGVLRPDRNTPPDSDRAVLGSVSLLPVYVVGAIRPTDDPAAVVGQVLTNDVSVAIGSDAPEVSTHGTAVAFGCAGACNPRLARAVHRPSGPVTAFLVDDMMHEVALLGSAGGYQTLAIATGSNTLGGAGRLTDADLDDLDGDGASDLAGLYTSTIGGPEEEVTLDLGIDGSGAQAVQSANITTTTATHLVIVREDTLRAILVLDDGGGTAACFTAGSGTALRECAP